MREFLDLANNPLFVKHFRSRMRRSAVVPGAVIVIFLCLLIVWVNSQARGVNNPDSTVGSIMIFWLQGILLTLLGGSQVASSIAQMKESGIIDFHRITPMPSRIQTIGIMLGAPIRELVFYGFTLPFALYLAVDGPIGIGNFAKLMLVQLGSALMYYSLAMITGLTGGKARGSSGRFVAILAVLNLTARSFFELGIYGPTLITIVPVYVEVFSDDPRPQVQQQFPPQRPGNNFPAQQGPAKKPEVTFYGAPLPIVVQSLMFQGSLLVFLFIGASRRINSPRIPLYSKPIAPLFLGTLCFLTLGSLWEAPVEIVTLGSAYFLAFCAILLVNAVTAPQGEVVKGIQRARKLSGLRVPIWSDLASNKFVVFFLACLIGLTITVGVTFGPRPPLRMPFFGQKFNPWLPLSVSVLALLSYGWMSQYLTIRFGKGARGYYVLYVFFAWIMPVVVGMMMMSARVEDGAYVMALSPFMGVLMSGAGGMVMGGLDEEIVAIASIAPSAALTLLSFILLISEERKLTSAVIDEHRRKRVDEDAEK